MSLSAEDKKKISRFLTSHIMHDQVTVEFGWKNFMLTAKQQDAVVINISSRMALHSLMRELNKLNESKKPEERIVVRAAAGGRKQASNSASYSATNVVNADIVIRLTGPDFANIHRTSNPNIMRVGASAQIGEIDKTLYEKFGLTLPTASLIPYVTAAGLAAAGGHGTGKDQPSFAGLIRGMTLCLENGEIVHIDQSHKDFKTIVGANNGLFGIVLDMDIECIPAKKMQCVMEKRSAIEFIEAVENGLFENDPYVSAMYVPTYLPDEATNRLVNNVIIYRWRPVPLDTNNTNHNPLLSELGQELQAKVGNSVNIPEILRTYPKLIPFYMRHLTAPLAIGDTDELSVGPWHEMMHYRTSFPTDLDEICGMFPVQDQPKNKPQGQEIVKALQKTITLLEEHAKRGEYPITYGLYFRYLQGTNGGLSITDHPEGSHICAMDLTTNINVPGFKEFQQSMQDYFLNTAHGKFHWGKNAPMDLDYQKIYGERWTETKAALESWHRDNDIKTTKSMLLNPLFSKVLDYPVPSLVDTDALPPRVTTAKKHLTAINARKLISTISDGSEECNKIKEELDAEINKTAISGNSIFKPAANDTDKAIAEDKKSSCAIL